MFSLSLPFDFTRFISRITIRYFFKYIFPVESDTNCYCPSIIYTYTSVVLYVTTIARDKKYIQSQLSGYCFIPCDNLPRESACQITYAYSLAN